MPRPVPLLVLLAACPAPLQPVDSGAPLEDAGEVVDAGLPLPPLEWAPCPLHSELMGGVMAECATVALPLRAGQGDDGGARIDVFVKRWAPDGGTRQRQLWMLMGGPGGSGMGYENVAEQIGSRTTDIEFYLPDHRGTGRSSRLGCPEQERTFSQGGFFITAGEWPACIDQVKQDHPNDLDAYSTTQAANDVGELIARAHDPEQTVFVYGASYGTYWAQRYLQLYPHQVDGVILDSIVSVPTRSLAEQDSDANEAGQLLFDGPCKSDALCAQKLGADPWATAQATLAKLKTGHCGAVATRFGAPLHVLLRRAFGQMMMGFSLRPYIPAVLYRADRCSPADEAALTQFLNVMFPGTQTPAAGKLYALWGWVLSNNVALSEMWPSTPVTVQDLQASREAAVVSRDVTTGLDPVVGIWPTYPSDAYVGAFATTDVPMLMLAGGLDPATLMRKQRLTRPHFTAAHQSWVEFPLGAHGILASSPTDAGTSCGTALMVGFMRATESPLDTACTGALRGLDFAGVPATTMTLLGTTDPWE